MKFSDKKDVRWGDYTMKNGEEGRRVGCLITAGECHGARGNSVSGLGRLGRRQ